MLLNGGSGNTTSVPSVVNMPVAQAEAAISHAGLVSTVHQVSSSTVKAGLVISTNPPFGNKVARASTVTLNVSAGPHKVKVPYVVGDSQTAATNSLQAFNVQTKTDASSTKPQGTVVDQSPSAGTLVAPGSTVTITVSGGGVQVPSTVGDPAATAQSILKNLGFNVVVNTVPGPANATPGNVFQQNPSDGAQPQGATITIYVAANTSGSPTGSPTDSGFPNPSGSPTSSGFGFPTPGQ